MNNVDLVLGRRHVAINNVNRLVLPPNGAWHQTYFISVIHVIRLCFYSLWFNVVTSHAVRG